jgi:membrane-bound lytic murein transglycosylase A
VIRLFAAGLLLLLAACQTAAPPPDKLVLKPARFADLPNWPMDRHADLLPALLKSCGNHLKRPPDQRLHDQLPGYRGDWSGPCALAPMLPPGDHAAARAFFETSFQPFQVLNNGQPEGLFTGYYEPELRGSLQCRAPYTVPLYRLPPELAAKDKPLFPDRAAIDQGALQGRGLELVCVDDAVDAFFLHIQGSGRVNLVEGGVMRVNVAGQNGHPYVAIGREMLKDGLLEPGKVSMQSIRAWLAANPAAAPGVMARNPSYIFFREVALAPEDGPLGAEGVPLTPYRSLAVDRRFLAYGVPVWLDVDSPIGRIEWLVMAQDTGGAIRGPVRGDLFWGWGGQAADIAGRMAHKGRYWILLPSPRVAGAGPSKTAMASD